MRMKWVGTVVLAVTLSSASPSGAAAISDETRCEIVKLKATVKELKDKAQCYERSLKGNVPVSQACFERAEQKRDRIFERAEERGGCKTTKDGPGYGARIDVFLREVTQKLAKGTPSDKASAETPAEAKEAEGVEKAKPAGTPSAKNGDGDTTKTDAKSAAATSAGGKE